MKLEQYVVGMVATNCYFLIDWDTKHIVIIDPGGESARLIKRIDDCGYIPEAILLTHGHFDHASEAAKLAAEYGIKIYANELERDTLKDPNLNLSYNFTGVGDSYKADIWLKDRERFRLLDTDIIMFSTPGHTAGGCCYYLPQERLLFSGDTLFCGSVGRTDFPGGSMSQLIRSVEDKLFCLDDDVRVYPGHDAATTIGREKTYNPYF